MRVYRDIYNEDGQYLRTDSVYDIMEVTYTGQDMGKRMISATIKSPAPIPFRLGDYVILQMQSLVREPGHNRGSVLAPGERFYIYTEPQCKKNARSMSAGDAFEITVNFYTRQYELSCIQMRDFIQAGANDAKIIYTGFDSVTFYGGARELLDRCMACMAQHYKGADGKGLWRYELADSLNEDKNNALERYAFSFSGNSVMDALMKLNDKDYINTTFFINERTIYVGFNRPYLCAVNNQGAITDKPLRMMYGKTSHLPIDKDFGGLFNITKSVGEEIPITKLFAYGAARNLNRYYCADRIQSGRFVNKLMLPSFSDDGETDYILSEDGVKKYGVNEGSKNFDEIYPSLRYMTYADIRGIKYCIKVKTSGLSSDQFSDGVMEHSNIASKVPMARVQCYKVEPCDGENIGRNRLVECAPPDDLVVFIHATGKTVKVVLYGGATNEEAIAKQLQHDPKVPTRTYGGTDYIPGSCFCVHDINFADMDGKTHDKTERESWFNREFRRYKDTDSLYAETPEQQVAELHRIEYVDTFWLTDLYVMGYDENGEALYDSQRNFKRDGYSAWAWPRLNNESIYSDNLPVNEVVAVEPIIIADTSDNINAGRQQHWDIYLRDLGFAIDEQNDFGEMVFVFATPVISVLDGILAGREFTIDGGENLNDFQDRVVCAYNEDGTFNNDFLFPGDSGDDGVPRNALLNGAVWRIRLNRNDQDSELSSVGLVIPNTDIQMKAGGHVVLLDIYMPDIYIRAAEQRLQREAIWYLEKNDKGNVKYSIALDQVRFNQIHNYALQMREGVRLRMEDADLNITSENTTRVIAGREGVPSETQVPMYTQDIIKHEDDIRSTTYTYYKNNSDGEPKSATNIKSELMGDERPGYSKWSLSIPKLSGITKYAYMPAGDTMTTDASGITIYEPNKSPISFDNFKLVDLIDRYHIEFQVSNNAFGGVVGAENITINIQIKEKVTWAESVKVYKEAGTFLPAISGDYVHFKSGKYYDVIVELNEESFEGDKWFWLGAYNGTHGSGDSIENDDQIFLTTSPNDLETRYKVPQYTKTFIKNMGGNMRRWKYSFYLSDSFNESNGYYVAFLYATPDNSGETKIDFGKIRLVSVTEKDLDEQGDEVNYVDFLVSSITVKIQDNTRPVGERVIGIAPEAIYDISAQIEEQTKATEWGTLMNNVEKTRVEQEQIKRTYETMANMARQNYQNLLNLKNNIFDPDGTCNDVFLQVMMLQVGADSMNYQLDYTFTKPDGTANNFSVEKNGAYYHFHVFDDDILHHFVYTQGAGNGGTWEIPGNFDCVLEKGQDDSGNDIWPVYYVCIRCKKDSVNDISEPAWICSPKQYAVNDEEDSSYWYFNWGILTPDSNGNYTLQETRGNAYMYGDNIVAGKISTIAGNSYFDLTHGNFVLSEGSDVNQAALSYIDGVLTIKGVNDDSEGSLLLRLGLLENAEIGGENLIDIEEEFVRTGEFDAYSYLSIPLGKRNESGNYIPFDAGNYVLSYEDLTVFDQLGSPVDYNVRLMESESSYAREIEFVDDKVTHFTLAEAKTLFLRITCFVSYECTVTIKRLMLQTGTQKTSYSRYVQHLTDALKGSTTIAGGLTMTNLMMLKNEQGEVKSGMSGLTNNGENVAMWAGGNYEQALSGNVPVLITKNGVGSKIGCFKVVSTSEVQVQSAVGLIRIDTATGGIRIIKEDSEKIVIVPQSLRTFAPTDSRSGHIGKSNITAAAYGFYHPSSLLLSITTTNSSDISLKYSYRIKRGARFADSNIPEGVTVYDASAKIVVVKDNQIIAEKMLSNQPITSSGVDASSSNVAFNVGQNLEAGTYNFYFLHDTNKDVIYHQGQTRSASIEDELITFSCDYEVIPYLEAKTVIGVDGLITAKDGKHFFMVDNSGDEQKIITKGLSQGKPSNPADGQLYISSNFIETFIALCEELDTAFQDVRFVGSNIDHSDAISAKLRAVKNALNDNKIISSI